MHSLLISLKQVDKIDDIEQHVEDLLRQKGVLEKIEDYTNDKIDFGDILETYNLLNEEIEKLQKRLKESKGNLLLTDYEEEEEAGEVSSSPTRFEMEDQKRFLDLVKGEEADVKMGKEEINRFLHRNKAKWYSSSQIAQAIGVSRPSVNKCLGRMRKHSEVQEKRIRVMLRGKLGFIPKEVPFYSYKRGL
jgi:transposase